MRYLYICCILYIIIVCVNSRNIKQQVMRDITKLIQSTSIVSLTMFKASIATAAVSSPDLRESIAKSLANVPGYGQPDIYYPNYFIGDWHVVQTMSLSINSPIKSSLIYPIDGNKTIEYNRKYVEYDGNIIQERSYSETQYMRQYLSDPYCLAQWDYRNPNNLNILTSNNKVSYTYVYAKLSIRI